MQTAKWEKLLTERRNGLNDTVFVLAYINQCDTMIAVVEHGTPFPPGNPADRVRIELRMSKIPLILKKYGLTNDY